MDGEIRVEERVKINNKLFIQDKKIRRKMVDTGAESAKINLTIRQSSGDQFEV